MEEPMTKERKFRPFDDGWSRQKKLCYRLVVEVTNLLLYVKLIVERDGKRSRSASKKGLKGALQTAEVATRNVEELYAIICSAERKAKERKAKNG
jgi:hypothetical protein